MASVHKCVPVSAKHLYNICEMLGQRRSRWADVVQMLNKWLVFAGVHIYHGDSLLVIDLV